MSQQKNWNNVGEQVRGAVQDALETGDFKQLNDVVAGTVNSALKEAKDQFKAAAGDFKDYKHYKDYNEFKEIPKDTFHYKKAGNYSRPKKNAQAAPPVIYRANVPAVKAKKIGSVSSVLYMVFGGIGTGLMSVTLLILGIILFFLQTPQMLAGVSITAVMLAFFIGMIQVGCEQKDRLKRADRYLQLSGGKKYVEIDDLAIHMRKSRKFIIKDIKKMLKLGFFQEGHLDDEKTCLMLDDATYKQYLSLQKERLKLTAGEKSDQKRLQDNGNGQALAAEAVSDDNTNTPEEATEIVRTIAAGQEFIRKLRDMNDNIEGEVISAKLYRLENLLKEIFDYIKEHPDQIHQMRKFMDYYLPTTLKLVQAYANFDNVSVPGEDILSAKTEIEKTLDTINTAFAELLNDLYRETVFDVTTDAQVLKSILAREGLTREMEKEKDIVLK